MEARDRLCASRALKGYKLKSALQAAVCHPLRLRVFAILAERPASPSESAAN